MSGLTAVDVLINPDDDALEHARRYNARLLKSLPEGFALDAKHTPHISVLQRYVRSADLDRFYGEVAKVIAETDFSAITFRSDRIVHIAVTPEVAGAAVALKPSPAMLDFHTRLIGAAAPFAESGGTAAAYVTDASEPDINQATLDFIEHFVPEHSGANYLPHISIGLAKLSDLTAIEAEQVDDFTVRPARVAVYHLGNNGTARVELKSWDI